MGYINGKWRQSLHLEPPCGWLNDPNGLCFFGGYYHVYFQYSPEHADGSGQKCWGHYRSRDLLKWEFTGTVLFPDIAEDRDGVYSGCAVATDKELHIFYTGNVKEAGTYDYIRSGRGANVIHVTTADGVTMSRKEILLRNEDYPDFCSCHVRDPKVWREDGKWHMVLGARTLEDKGCVLFYISENLTDWSYSGNDSISDFGYMWECPDCFRINGHRYLGISPQGLAGRDTAYQNIYQAGYFRYDKPLKENAQAEFTEWDMGFDFYAPQSFEAPDGRRLMIGWMGIGDIPYSNPTIELGYQHCLTLPREVTIDENGMLCQKPIRELALLRGSRHTVTDGGKAGVKLPFEVVSETRNSFAIRLGDSLYIRWNGEILELKFMAEECGRGRSVRKARLDSCRDIRILADNSSLEIYADGGRCVMSSRFYPQTDEGFVSVEGLDAELYELEGMEVKYLGE